MKNSRRSRFIRFLADVRQHTPITRLVLLLGGLWLLFAVGVFLAERGQPGSPIQSLGDALYWAVAAFSTAGIADTPATDLAKLIGGIWIVVGSLLFFGAIVATVTGYFMRPMQRPHKRIIETIEYNLDQLETLDVEELHLLKETVDGLLEHMEKLARRREKQEQAEGRR